MSPTAAVAPQRPAARPIGSGTDDYPAPRPMRQGDRIGLSDSLGLWSPAVVIEVGPDSVTLRGVAHPPHPYRKGEPIWSPWALVGTAPQQAPAECVFRTGPEWPKWFPLPYGDVHGGWRFAEEVPVFHQPCPECRQMAAIRTGTDGKGRAIETGCPTCKGLGQVPWIGGEPDWNNWRGAERAPADHPDSIESRTARGEA